MADAQKKSESKGKNASLDLDIGNDFLSSWKTMSAVDGDGIDFDMPPVSKGSKKPFNFDKADMDFNLDGDFGKLTSFDMDMSDLDISPPFKKDGKSTEKSKESSKGNEKGKADWKLSSFEEMNDFDISPPFKKDGKSNKKSNEPTNANDKGKVDRFSFAFDFDELDNFSFEPSTARKDSKTQKDKDNTLENQKDKDDTLENLKFDPCTAKESSKVQKDKDGTGNMENLEFMPSLEKECLKIQKDKDKIGSPENSNFEPALEKEGSKIQRENDGIGGLESFGTTDEDSKVRNYKDSSQNLPHRSVCQNMEASTPMDLTGNTSNMDEGNQKPPLVETTVTCDQVGGNADVKSRRENCPLKLAIDEPAASKLAIDEPVSSTWSAATDQASYNVSKARPEIVIASTEPPKAFVSNKSLSLEPVHHETNNGNGFKFFSDSHSNSAPSGCNASISDARDTYDGMGVTSTGSVEANDANVISDVGPNWNYKCKMSKTSSHFRTVATSEKDNNEMIQNGIKNHVMDNKEQTELSEVNAQVENHSINNVVSEILTDNPTGRENQKLASEITAFSSVSQLSHEVLPDKESKNGETSLARSGAAIQLEKSKASSQKTPLTLTTVFPLSSKKTAFAQPSLVEEKRNQENDRSDRKLASIPRQTPYALLRMELPKTKSRESRESIDIMGQRDTDVAGVQKMRILSDSFTQNLDLVKAKPAARERGTSVKDLHIIRSSLASSPSLKVEVNKKTAQITLASLSALNRKPVETEKISAAVGIKKKPELCTPKLSSLSFDSTKSPSRNEMRLAGNIRQTSDSLINTPRSIAPLHGMQKKTISPLSLKRKSLEEHNADTVMSYPSKRVSQSPNLSRNFMETSKSAFDKKVSYNNSIGDNCIKNTLEAYQVSATDIFHKVNGRAMEMSIYIENDTNIKQAEACTKELDDICDMLRKKQEDAKELLVRATMNSNRMLMLNYHLIEQKIGAMKNSFAKLSLNKICA